MPLDPLTWTALTRTVDERKKANQFLTRLIFGEVETHHVEQVEFSILTNSRIVAPFVRKGGSAIMVGGVGWRRQQFEPTNIRVKRPFTPSELLFGRQPGTSVFVSPEEQMAAVEEHIARDMREIDDQIVNAEEWLSAMALQGTVAYEVADQENYSITFPKPVANTVVLTGGDKWDNADPTIPNPTQDFLDAKRQLSDEVDLQPTDAIMGRLASENFQRMMQNRPGLMDASKLTVGQIDFTQQFNENGAIFIGMFCGVRCWEYGRSSSLAGVSTNMIRTNYVEFICRTPAARFKAHYGAIPDVKALRGRAYRGRRFAKSWEVEDPSSMMALEHSRPLMVTERPGAVYSLKVQDDPA